MGSRVPVCAASSFASAALIGHNTGEVHRQVETWDLIGSLKLDETWPAIGCTGDNAVLVGSSYEDHKLNPVGAYPGDP